MRKLFFCFSVVIVAFALVSIFVLKGFNKGIDFTGGISARLSINFEKSSIAQLRDMFSDVQLTRKAVVDKQSAADQTNKQSGAVEKFSYNLGKNISRLNQTGDVSIGYPSQSYMIRVKNLPGVEKEQIEKALSIRLTNKFKQKTKVSFTVDTADLNDDGAALQQLLTPVKVSAVSNRTVTITDDSGRKVQKKRFYAVQTFPGKVKEALMRKDVTRQLLQSNKYTLSSPVEFRSTVDWGSFNTMSSNIGREMESAAISLSIVVSLIILIYIAVRFNYKFGLAAIGALIHDIIILLGVISFFGHELTIPIVAAIMTIFGYSINDTIVVFDRVRENLESSRKEDLPHVLNKSITQSLSRTLITSLTTLLAVLAIFLFAGTVLRDFSFALIIGIFIGTYSSVYIASPLYLLIEKFTGSKELKKKRS